MIYVRNLEVPIQEDAFESQDLDLAPDLGRLRPLCCGHNARDVAPKDWGTQPALSAACRVLNRVEEQVKLPKMFSSKLLSSMSEMAMVTWYTYTLLSRENLTLDVLTPGSKSAFCWKSLFSVLKCKTDFGQS